MIFIQAKVDAFGKWIDTTFEFANQRVNGFYGENESGKSTLQQFLLYMLFGLPPKQRKAFRPKSRNEIGGDLTLKDPRFGTVLIKRMEAQCTCYLETGEIEGEAWWNNQLKGLTKEVYTSIYAFAATDLSAIRTMDQADISNVLFSIGLTGSTAIYEVEKNLANKLDALYKKQGRRPLINEQIKQVATTYEKLQTEKTNEKTYQPLKQQMEQLASAIKTDQLKLKQLQQQLLLLGKVKQALPLLHEHESHTEELTALPNNIIFPKDGIERLEKIKTFIFPLKSEKQILQGKVDEYRKKDEKTRELIMEDEFIQRAKSLVEEQSAYDQNLFVRKENEKKLQLLDEKIERLYRNLEWETDETAGIPLPFHLETSWKEMQHTYEFLQNEKDQLADEKMLAEERMNQLTIESSQIEKQMLPTKQLQKIERQIEQDASYQTNKQQAKQWQQWEKRRLKTAKTMMYSVTALAVVALIVAFFQASALFYSLSFLLVLFGVMQYFFTIHHHKTMEKMFQQTNETDTLSESEREYYEAILEKEKRLRNEMEHRRNEQRKLEYDKQQWNERMQLHEQKQQQLTRRLETERGHYPFLNGIEVLHWLELLQMIRELKELQAEKTTYKKENHALLIKNRRVEKRISEFPYADSLEAVKLWLDKQYQYIQTSQQYGKEIEQFNDKKLQLLEQINLHEQEKNELFNQADVKDEETFYERASQLDQKRKHENAIHRIQQQLENLFPADTVEDLLQDKMDETQLEGQEKEIMDRNRMLEEKITENQQTLAEIQIELKQLETAEDPSLLAYRFQMEKDVLNEQARHWSILKIAQIALEKAKQSYQKKYLTDVIDWTTLFFSRLTNGKYTTVYAPTDDIRFQVEGKERIRYTIDELSQGTIDQLYVSLRFAIAKVMSEMYEMPLLIDDAFVHFDDIRTDQAIEIMKGMAEEKQIIFFTCKQEIARSLQAGSMNRILENFEGDMHA